MGGGGHGSVLTDQTGFKFVAKAKTDVKGFFSRHDPPPPLSQRVWTRPETEPGRFCCIKPADWDVSQPEPVTGRQGGTDSQE